MTALMALLLSAAASGAATCSPLAPPGMVAREAAFGGVIRSFVSNDPAYRAAAQSGAGPRA